MSRPPGSPRPAATTLHTPRLGLCFRPDHPPERLLELARRCDGAVDELWLWEDCFKESGLTPAVAALATTTRLRVGVGLMPAPLRNVALLAMEIAAVHRMFPGRFLPGIGHGVQEWMGQAGARVTSPMTLLDEYAVALRALLDGERVTSQGRYVRLEDVALDWPPPPGTPLLMGGFGPRTLELSGRLGDAVLVSWPTRTELLAAREAARRGWSTAGRRGEPELVVSVTTARGPDAAERVARASEEVGKHPEPGLVAAGDAHGVVAGIREAADLGATTVVLVPELEEDLVDLADWLGREVRPRLAGRPAG